jgi:hypothetical protein
MIYKLIIIKNICCYYYSHLKILNYLMLSNMGGNYLLVNCQKFYSTKYDEIIANNKFKMISTMILLLAQKSSRQNMFQS